MNGHLLMPLLQKLTQQHEHTVTHYMLISCVEHTQWRNQMFSAANFNKIPVSYISSQFYTCKLIDLNHLYFVIFYSYFTQDICLCYCTNEHSNKLVVFLKHNIFISKPWIEKFASAWNFLTFLNQKYPADYICFRMVSKHLTHKLTAQVMLLEFAC